MEKCDVQLFIRIRKSELDVLIEKADKAGVSRSEFIRRLIMEYKFPEKPDPKFMSAFFNLSNIGESIQEVAKEFDSWNPRDYHYLMEQVRELEELKREIQDTLLQSWRI